MIQKNHINLGTIKYLKQRRIERMNEKKYAITIYNTKKLNSMQYVDLELHYDEIMQDVGELIQYLHNVRERLLIKVKEAEYNDNE